MALRLSLAVCDYDRTRAIFDGRAPIEGCDITAVNLEPEEAFHRAFKFQEFDISEISMSSYTMTTARGDAHYVAVPAFVSRLFRHSGIYIRTDRGIAKPQDLKGKTIGLPEYQITANVWIRGILQDEYGVKPSDIKWRSGGIEEAGPRRARADQAARATSTSSLFPSIARCRRCSPPASSTGSSARGRRRASCAACRTSRGCSPTIRRPRRPISARPGFFRSCMRSASAARSSRSIPGSR